MSDRGEGKIVTATSTGLLYHNGEIVSDSGYQEPFITEDTSQQVKPKMAELMSNAAEAAKTILLSGGKVVSEEERQQRFGVCLLCNHLSDSQRCVHILQAGRLEKGCGCYMPVKVNFAAMKCPNGKW